MPQNKPTAKDPQWVRNYYEDFKVWPKGYQKESLDLQKKSTDLLSKRLANEKAQKLANAPVKAFAVKDPITGKTLPDSLKYKEGSSAMNTYLKEVGKGSFITEPEKTKETLSETRKRYLENLDKASLVRTRAEEGTFAQAVARDQESAWADSLYELTDKELKIKGKPTQEQTAKLQEIETDVSDSINELTDKELKIKGKLSRKQKRKLQKIRSNVSNIYDMHGLEAKPFVEKFLKERTGLTLQELKELTE